MVEATMNTDEPTHPAPVAPRLRVQSVLFMMDPASILKAIRSLAAAARYAIQHKVLSAVEIGYGDCSPSPSLTGEQIDGLRAELDVRYSFFGANLGSARGHNTLAENTDADYLMILNPDVLVGGRTLYDLMTPFGSPTVGMTEGRQLPVEHPKHYDPYSGSTGWATTACAITPTALFRELGGFDADTFFLYCDDVDYSWRVREAGRTVIYRPSAIAFHDKRLSRAGAWQPSGAERYYSAEASLLMAHKWSRPDLVKRYLHLYEGSTDELQQRAAREFRQREREGRLPAPRDAGHHVGYFRDDRYAQHRYPL